MSAEEVDHFLEHYGVKGMKWGVRKERPGGASRKVNREARKDAEEFVRSRAYYGKGAGTRRKLIDQTIAGKSRRLPGYKEALEVHKNDQDTSKHASKAVKERKRTDRKEKTSKTAGAVARRVTGEWGTQAAFVAIAASGVAYSQSPRGKAMMNKSVRTIMDKKSNATDAFKRRQGAKKIADMLKDM